jgi:guanine deaminase
MTREQEFFMQMAIEASRKGMDGGNGGPFGCVIVKDGKLLVAAHNEVLATNDPTAHAEVVAIRKACQLLGDFELTGCELYASCEPCPMCLGAIYWARPARVFYAATHSDAAEAGFDDSFIYKELHLTHTERAIPFERIPMDSSTAILREWKNKEGKRHY